MKTETRRKHTVFDLIAPVYGLFFKYQKNRYRIILQRMSADMFLPAMLKVLDVGCGTGALCSVFHERGYDVTGIDPSQKMLDIASKKPENKNVSFLNASVLKRLPFTDKCFDITIASFVAHGLKPVERQAMYAEMSRVTRNLVILHDYNDTRSFATSVIEWLEGGDYFNFIRVVRDELGEAFVHVRIVNVDKRAAWYICSQSEN